MRYHLTYWREISDSNWIVQTARGYRLELIRHPPSTPPPRQPRLSVEQQGILDLEVHNLLQKRAIEECHDQGGFYSSLFIVPKKDGGWRTIINLKNLNKYLRVQHFKMESIYSVRDVLHRGDWMAKLDLQDAYLTVPIFHSHRRLLRFQWRAQAYQFRCLPFGLATAPRVFTKLMKPVVTCRRQQGIRLVQYLDDTLLVAESPEALKAHLRKAANLLEELGFSLNQKKCVWTPTQRMEFLGFEVDSNTKISLPSTQKGGEDQEGMQECESSRPPDSQKTSTPDWPACLYTESQQCYQHHYTTERCSAPRGGH